MSISTVNGYDFGFEKVPSKYKNHLDLAATVNSFIVDYDHWISFYIQQYFINKPDLSIHVVSITDSDGWFPSIYDCKLCCSIFYSYKGVLHKLFFKLEDLNWMNNLKEDSFKSLNSQLDALIFDV